MYLYTSLLGLIALRLWPRQAQQCMVISTYACIHITHTYIHTYVYLCTSLLGPLALRLWRRQAQQCVVSGMIWHTSRDPFPMTNRPPSGPESGCRMKTTIMWCQKSAKNRPPSAPGGAVDRNVNTYLYIADKCVPYVCTWWHLARCS
jgi:hypothetical protein